MLRSVSESLAAAFAAYGSHEAGATADGTADAAIDAKTRLCLQDFLGNALCSVALPWVSQAIAAVADEGPPEATIIGSDHRSNRSGAAFANAVAGHALVRDDMHVGAVSHLGVVVVPTVLALAETGRVSGRALLDAIVVGYEAGGLLGRAILDSDISRTHRPTGTVGPVAAAAAAAKLLGADETRFAAALGLAANMAAGYNEWAPAGGSEMFFHPGFAARNALLAVRLAMSGATVSRTAFEGKSGMLAAFGKHWPEHARPFTDRPEILDVFFKEVPACNYAQTAAQAARDLAGDQPFAAEVIEEVIVRLPHAAIAYPGCDAAGPLTTILQAKMSIQFNVAAALTTGHFAESNYLPENQPGICRVASRIRLLVDDELTRAYPSRQGAEVSVRTNDGRRLSRQLKNVVAASAELVRTRFEETARRALGDTTAAKLVAMIDAIDSVDDVSPLLSACRVAHTDDDRSATD